jgi:hypothetical protein
MVFPCVKAPQTRRVVALPPVRTMVRPYPSAPCLQAVDVEINTARRAVSRFIFKHNAKRLNQ